MKKFLTLGVLTVALAAVSTPEAPAWLNWKVGIGANMGWQSGGNNTLWGLFRNGQPPAPETCGGVGFPGGGFPGGYPGSTGGIPHTFYQPNSLEHGVNAAAEAPASTIPARTQSFSQTPWTGQTANYQYPYQYPYYYNYGYSYYGYGR